MDAALGISVVEGEADGVEVFTPWIAVTPDKSVMVPTEISLSVTPVTGSAAKVGTAAGMPLRPAKKAPYPDWM
jgi:hypothetical protein